jgi:hypothetical protein
VSEPIKTTVVRWKCPHCNRHHARKHDAIAHIGRCWKNPANRTCRTCVFFRREGDGSYCFPGRPCDCNAPETWCDADVELPADGLPMIGCALWELAVKP